MHSISLIVYRPPITEANSLPCAIFDYQLKLQVVL